MRRRRDPLLSGDLSHVHWLGGGSGAGKSTVARRLADRHGLTIYATDDAMADHAGRCGADACPALHAFLGMDMDKRWVRRTPQAMLDTFHWFRGEGFDLILSDLAALPRDRPVIAEGSASCPVSFRRSSGSGAGPCSSCRRRPFAGPRSRRGERSGPSPGGRAIRTVPCRTSSNATVCSPTAWRGKRSARG